MIKFRCLNCGQKLAVADEGVNAVISCINCKEYIVVPPYSISDFFPSNPLSRPPAARIVENGTRPENLPAVREALVPHLAKMMMNRLFQAIFNQRESLLNTQAEASRRMDELEEKLNRTQTNVEKKIALYEARIAELEGQLAVKEEENRALMRTNFQLAKKALEADSAPQSAAPRVNLSDAGFLLRA